MVFYSQNGMSAIVEKLFGMENVSIHPIVCTCKLRVKDVEESDR